jgi:hypothetical protein
MIELECPWCEQPARLDLAVLAETAAFSCESCRVEVEFAEGDLPRVLALAA